MSELLETLGGSPPVEAASEAVSEAASEAASPGLCRSCAACCDGTLFSVVPVSPGDGFSVVQPCPHLAERSCTRYGERPRACAAFRCTVLDGVESGELGRPEALALVGELRAAADELRRTLHVASDRALPEFLYDAEQRWFDEARTGVAAAADGLFALARYRMIRRRFVEDPPPVSPGTPGPAD